jgi:hypothetical protein
MGGGVAVWRRAVYTICGLMRMQSAYDIAQPRWRAGQIKVKRYKGKGLAGT